MAEKKKFKLHMPHVITLIFFLIIVVAILDKYEIGIIINALNEFRNRLLREKEDTEPVDEVLLKAIDAPEKKDLFQGA